MLYLHEQLQIALLPKKKLFQYSTYSIFITRPLNNNRNYLFSFTSQSPSCFSKCSRNFQAVSFFIYFSSCPPRVILLIYILRRLLDPFTFFMWIYLLFGLAVENMILSLSNISNARRLWDVKSIVLLHSYWKYLIILLTYTQNSSI